MLAGVFGDQLDEVGARLVAFGFQPRFAILRDEFDGAVVGVPLMLELHRVRG
jgi:hypothetical protein